ncbi:capsular polysaccharide export protein, LipB/KpsS family [Alishewanella longhuensis]
MKQAKPLADYQCLAALSAPIYQLPGLKALLGCRQLKRLYPWFPWYAGKAEAILAWGRKPSARYAEGFAAKHQLPLLRIEDGFLRSVGLGFQCPPCSVVVDDIGIYYDAAAPSRLELFIAQSLSAAEQQYTLSLIQLWCESRVSKYNHAPEPANLPAPGFVLVVDQTFGDAAIGYGLADAASFSTMLAEAFRLFPEQQIVIKTHPDVVAGKKKGHFNQLSAEQARRVIWLTEDCHPPALLEHAAAVFCVTSQMGFEALLWGVPVYTFGMPFYAGWGLTTDFLPAPSRRCKVPLTQLANAALVKYPRYIDPVSLLPIACDEAIRYFAKHRTALTKA